MKKYLKTGALAFIACGFMTSCHETEIDYASQIEAKKTTFAENFVKFYGEIDPNQDWGFGTTTSGFTRSGNTGETYPATHVYTDAYGNVIAGANMNRNQWGSSDLISNPYGGWIVPDPLTEGQKLRVQMYFQANPNLGNHDPHYRHFYVQQVYTGGTDKSVTTGNKEQNVAADGTTIKTGASLNQLTVGEANSHINDFNSGTCTLVNNVLNHKGETQKDQITLMVNVDDTSCFGYHETAGSNVNVTIQHNDKWALVSAKDIDDWAEENGNPGLPVQDEWNRSFMGFDYEMLPQQDVIVPNTYAMLNQVQNINNCQYAVLNNQIMKIGQNPAGEAKDDLDITDNLVATSGDAKIEKQEDGNLIWNGKYITVNVNADATGYTKLVIEYAEATPNGYNLSVSCEGGYLNGYDPNRKSDEIKVECDLVNVTKITTLTFMNGNTNFVIKKAYLTSGANEVYYDSEYLLADTEMIPFYIANTDMYGGQKIKLTNNDFYTTVDDKTCLNLDRIKQLYDDGYRPIDTALWDWVKYEPVCDGYYSDWIVTLTEAKRISEITTTGGTITTGQTTTGYYLRKYVQNHRWVFCEDLGQASNRKDFDYNDLVFDAKIIQEYEVTNTDGVETVTEKGSPYALITPLAAGGELTISVADKNVHEMFGLSDAVLINTIDPNTDSDVRSSGVPYAPTNPGRIDCTTTATYPTANILDIPINVQIYNNAFEILSRKGQAPHKIAVTPGTRWAQERVDINEAQPGFADWVKDVTVGANFWSYEASANRYPYMPSDEYLVNDMTKKYLPDEYIEGGTTDTYSVNLASNENSLWLDETGSASVEIQKYLLNYYGVAEGSIIRIYGVGNSAWELNVSNISGSEAWTDKKSGDSALFGYVEFKLNASTAELIKNSNGMKITGSGLTILCVSIDNTLVRNNTSN